MVMQKQLTAIIEREGDGYVSLCPELDIASQGDSVEEAREGLREALELFFETASKEEIETRLHEEIYITRLEVAVG
jgi:predicted RNase H-like HicB family nuclease